MDRVNMLWPPVFLLIAWETTENYQLSYTKIAMHTVQVSADSGSNQKKTTKHKIKSTNEKEAKTASKILYTHTHANDDDDGCKCRQCDGARQQTTEPHLNTNYILWYHTKIVKFSTKTLFVSSRWNWICIHRVEQPNTRIYCIILCCFNMNLNWVRNFATIYWWILVFWVDKGLWFIAGRVDYTWSIGFQFGMEKEKNVKIA